MSKTREYIASKNIGVLFEELMRHVINKKPDNPVHFLIGLLQEKGDTLLNTSNSNGFGCDGPSYRGRNTDGLECEGQALDIRKSLERFLPKSVNAIPVKMENEKEGETTTTSAAHPVTETVIDAQQIPKTSAEVVEVTNVNVSKEKDQPTTDVVVSQEYVTAVQSSFKDSRRSSSGSTASSATIKSAKSDEKEKSEKKNNSKDKFKNDKEKDDKVNKKKKKEKKEKIEEKTDEEGSEKSKGSETIELKTIELKETAENENEDNNDQEENKVQEEKDVIEKEENIKEEENDKIALSKNEEEEDKGSVMMTGSCDLTEIVSWYDGNMDIESLLEVSGSNAVQHDNVRTVNSAAPVTKPTKQNEYLILKDETFYVKARLKHRTPSPKQRSCSPCNTVFFEESDTEPPVITDPPTQERQLLAVFSLPETLPAQADSSLANLLADQRSNNFDKMSISELSGSPWTYAESIS